MTVVRQEQEEAFRGRRVLVTGDTGFKGSWLALWLHELGAEVTGVALPADTDPSHYELLGLSRMIRHHDVDIRDADALAAVVSSARPEIVFHLAAQAIVRASYDDPMGTIASNVMGTVHLLEAVRRSPSVRAAVMVTSDKCYENREWPFAYRENDPMGGHDPYSASKGAAELLISSYRRSFFSGTGEPGLASVRAGNVIGGGDWAENRIVPDCARALLAGEPVELRNPQAVRPWQHVLEPLSGYLSVAAHLLEDPRRYAEAYNFGPAAEGTVTVAEVARRFVERAGRGQVIEAARDEDAPHEAHLLRLACDKAHHDLGWRPRLCASEAIDWTVEWYQRVNDDPGAAEKMSRAQIRRYLAP